MVDTAITSEMPKKRFYGWINATLLTFIYMGTSGMIFYAFSVIFPFMLKDTGWGRGDASIAITVSSYFIGFLMPVAAKLLNIWGSRKVIIIGLAITTVNLFLLSTVVSKLWQWIALWGLMVPVGRVLCGLLPSQLNLMFWFNKKRSMAMGLLMMGAPLGGMIGPPLITKFMQYMGGWRFGWMLSTAFMAMATVIGFWIKNKPSDVGQYPDGIAPGEKIDEGTNETSKSRTKIFRTNRVWSLKEVLRTRTIWMITIAGLTNGMTLGMIVYHGVLHLKDVGFDPMKAAFVLSVIMGSSLAARLPVGWLGDHVEPRWIYFTALVMMTIGMVGIWKAPSYYLLLLVFGPCYGLAYGSILTINPTLYGNYFGPEVFASIRGALGPFVTFLTAPVAMIAGYVFEKYGSYDYMFTALAIMMVVGIICAAFMSPPPNPDEKT